MPFASAKGSQKFAAALHFFCEQRRAVSFGNSQCAANLVQELGGAH